MELKRIDDNYSVSEQISIDDLDAIKDAGFQTVICNRPDDEAPDQPNHTEVEKKARSLGLEFKFLPIGKGTIQDTDIEKFRKCYPGLPKPALAFCRSGTRSATVWSLAHAADLDIDEIMEKTAAAGYDMSAHSERLKNGGLLPTD